MRAIRLLAWRNLSDRPVRTLLMAVGVILGVALVLATSIGTRTLDREFAALDAGDAGKAALVVTGTQEPWMAESLAGETLGAAGVWKAYPQVQGGVTLSLPSGFADVQMFAVDLKAESDLHTYELAAGTLPDGPGLLLEERWAEQRGLKVGDSVSLYLTKQDRVTWPLTGLIKAEGIGRFNGGGVALLPLGLYQQETDRTGKVSRILLTLKPGADTERALNAVQAMLPEHIQVTEAGGALGERQPYQIGLGFFAGVATLVGAFMIFGSFSLALRQRLTETGMLRAVGATSGQVAWAYILEATGIGLAGSIVGVPLGILLSTGMLRLVQNALNGRQATQWAMAPADVLVAVAVGVGVSLLASLAPAWRVSRTPPAEVIRSATAAPVQKGYGVAIAGLCMAVASLFGWVWAFQTGSIILSSALNWVYYLGVALAIPLLVRWLVTFVVQPIARRTGAVPLLAAGNLLRNISRATVTVTATMVSVAMLISFGAVEESYWKGTEDFINQTVAGDMLATGDLTPDVVAGLRAVPGIETLTPQGSTKVRSEAGWEAFASAIEAETYRNVMPFRLHEGDREQALAALERGGGIVLTTNLARKHGFQVGDTLRFEQRDGRGNVLPGQYAELQVVGLFDANLDSGQSAIIGRGDADRYFGGVLVNRAFAKLKSDADFEAVAAAVGTAFPMVKVTDVASVRATYREHVKTDLMAFKAILYAALVTSALGIVNTMALSIMEQRRELALLRAVGATSGQASLMVVIESVFLGAVGGGLGLLAGALYARSFVEGAAAFMTLVAPFTFPVQQTVVTLVVTVLLAALASFVPAWRAGRVAPAAALRNQ